MEFRLLIDIEVIEILDGLPKRSRTRLLDQFQKIRSFSGNYSDCYEHDASGRPIEISIVSFPADANGCNRL